MCWGFFTLRLTQINGENEKRSVRAHNIAYTQRHVFVAGASFGDSRLSLG